MFGDDEKRYQDAVRRMRAMCNEPGPFSLDSWSRPECQQLRAIEQRWDEAGEERSKIADDAQALAFKIRNAGARRAAEGASPAARYEAAVSYVRQVLDEARPGWWNPIGKAAYEEKSRQVVSDLGDVTRKWDQASDASAREEAARQAELLADRVEENFPGAQQTWKRTNLYPGETPMHAPDTSFLGEVFHDNASREPVTKPIDWKQLAIVGGSALAVGGILGALAVESIKRR